MSRGTKRALLVAAGGIIFLRLFILRFFLLTSASMEPTLYAGDLVMLSSTSYGLRLPEKIPFTSIHLSPDRIPSFTAPERGDVAAFYFPGHLDSLPRKNRELYVKRVIGLPGDTVEIRDDTVFINNSPIFFPGAAQQPLSHSNGMDNFGPVVVPFRGMTIGINKKTIDRWLVFIRREKHAIETDVDGVIRIDGYAKEQYQAENEYFFMLGDNRTASYDSRHWGFVPSADLIGKVHFIVCSIDELRKFSCRRIGKAVK